jgi:hypothetical protein
VNAAASQWRTWLRRRRLAPAARSVVLAMSVGAGFGLLAEPVAAQGRSTPTISIPATIATPSASQVPLQIRVGPTGAIPRHSFVRVRGLPPMAALSEGHAIAPGAWAIPLAALPDLKIMMPAGAVGRSDFVATLVAIDGSVLAAAKSTLVVGSTQQGQKAEPSRVGAPPEGASILRAGAQPRSPETPARSGGPAPKAASSQRMTPEDRERAQRFKSMADEEMEQGNISAARLLLERATDLGLPEAAMALGATYDPPELSRLHAHGVVPNRNEARRWYQRASELGAEGAAEQLQRLGAK